MIKINIILTSLNAKYIHSSLALRSLQTYTKEFSEFIKIKEYTINHSVDFIISDLFKEEIDAIGFSCYIWNIEMTLEIIEIIKLVNPKIKIFIGGPEVFDEIEKNKNIDITIFDEGEETFLELVKHFIYKEKSLNAIDGIAYRENNNVFYTKKRKSISLDDISFVYSKGLDGLENKIIYYESSRGCPFDCQYCLSSTLNKVRFLSLERTFSDLKFFLEEKVSQVKFVDRTFNCDKKRASDIWNFLIENDNGITNFHFEIAADILENYHIDILQKARVGLFQFEIGVQSTNIKTLEIIKRKTDLPKLFSNVSEIKNLGNIHQHLDLIAGLPNEDFNSFKKSFNDVYNAKPEKLQLGFLKLLKETGLRKNADDYGIVYRKKSPYEFLFTRNLTFFDNLKLKKIEETLEMFYNSSKFFYTLQYVLKFFESPFDFYEHLSDFWDKNNYFEIYSSKTTLYLRFLEFCNHCNINEDKIINDFLKYDLLINDNYKNLPEEFTYQLNDDEKSDVVNFYKNAENTTDYFKGLEDYTLKQKFRMTHVEKFKFNIWEYLFLGANLELRDNFILFNYNLKNNSLIKMGINKAVSFYIKSF